MDIAQMIDHAVLHPTATDDDLRLASKVAINHKVASLCVKPYHVVLAKSLLATSNIPVCTVIGFPHGSQTIQAKTEECKQAIKEGAKEIDVVINIGQAIQGAWAYLAQEISTLTSLCHQHNCMIKVIFETDYISSENSIQSLCKIANKYEVDFVKTSTGFGFKKHSNGFYHYEGAQEQHIVWMRKYTNPSIGIKASGGIRTKERAIKLVALGASRIGTSSTEKMLNH